MSAAFRDGDPVPHYTWLDTVPEPTFTCTECENVQPLPYAGGDDDHPTCGYCMGSEMLGLRRG